MANRGQRPTYDGLESALRMLSQEFKNLHQENAEQVLPDHHWADVGVVLEIAADALQRERDR